MLSLRTSDRRHWCGNPSLPSPRTAIVLSFRASAHTGVGIRSPAPAPQARQFFLPLPPAVTFLSIAKERRERTPPKPTVLDSLGALRPAANLPYVPRVIAFPVCRCRSKGLCHHSLPLPLRCRCPVPRQQLPPLSPYRGTPRPNATTPLRTVIPSQPAGWRGNPYSPKAPSEGFIYCCGAARRTYLLRCKAPAKGAI